MLSLFVVALVVGSARCAIPTIDYFTICDDIQHVYAAHSLGVDEIGTLNKWNTTLHVKIPTTTKVLAISCKNKGGPAGLLGSTNDGRILTNSTWKCSNTLESDWNTVDFDDSSWPDAVQVDTNVAPGPVHHGWKVQNQIDPTAVWISTQENNIPAGTTSYCRLKLVFEFLMICDDNSTLYVDGLRVGEQGAGALGYKYVSNPLEIPRLATTFAISCENAGGFTAFMGASKSGDLVTDAKWKVKRLAMKKSDTVRIPEPIGWAEPEFDDSTWQNALLIVDNKIRKPTYQSWIPTIKTQIDSDAWWIGAVPQPIETGTIDRKDKSVLLIRRKLSCMWTQTC